MSVSGGNLAGAFTAWGEVTFHGDDFRVDNIPVAGLDNVGDSVAAPLEITSEFTGVLADGTPFAFSFSDDDQPYHGNVTLVRAETPPVDALELHVPGDAVPRGLRAGQTLFLGEGGSIGDDFHAAAGSAVVIDGGAVGDNFEVAGATVDVRQGAIGGDLGVFSGGVVNMSGGAIDAGVNAMRGSELNVRGGRIGTTSSYGGAVIDISGGRFEHWLYVIHDSHVILRGLDFELNGEPISGLDVIGATRAVDVPESFVLAGTLSDGSPFAFSSNDFDHFDEGTLTLVRADAPPVQPGVISVPEVPAPTGIRAGQTLIVGGGGVVKDSFNAGAGSTVVVDGGTVGENLEAVGALIEIRGGNVGDGFDAFAGTRVHISGGEVGRTFYAGAGSEVRVSGGTIGEGIAADDGSSIHVTGGTVNALRGLSGSDVTISGGDIGGFYASAGADVELIGRAFLLEGNAITGLTDPGDSIQLDVRDGQLLHAELLDGSAAEFILRQASRGVLGNFAVGSQLRLTVAVPEPSGATLLVGCAIALLGGRSVRRHPIMPVEVDGLR